MNHKLIVDVMGELVKVAECRETITYGKLGEKFGLDPHGTIMRMILDHISILTNAEEGVLLSSVVVLDDGGIPGDGYYLMAFEQGCDIGSDREAFHKTELERLYDLYSRG